MARHVYSSDCTRRNSCAVCQDSSSCYRDVGGILNVRRTSARGSSLQGRVFKFVISCILNGNFNIITLDHMRETKNNPIRDTFTTRSTEPSWKLGRCESGQHQASFESPRLPRRSRRVCVGFRCISSKFMLLGCCRSLISTCMNDRESSVSGMEVGTTLPTVYGFSVSIEGGRYHMVGVARFTKYH